MHKFLSHLWGKLIKQKKEAGKTDAEGSPALRSAEYLCMYPVCVRRPHEIYGVAVKIFQKKTDDDAVPHGYVMSRMRKER